MRSSSGFPLIILSGLAILSACTPPPSVNDSRELLWSRYAHQPIDNLLLSWGAPDRETHLSDGSRLLTYRHATTYDAQSPYERTTGCELSVLAQSPGFRIENIALQGDAYECRLLAQGQVGAVRQMAVPTVYPPPYIYHHYPY